MVEPLYPWPKPLIEIKRYCILEWYVKEPSTGDRHWFYKYNDGILEILTIKGDQK